MDVDNQAHDREFIEQYDAFVRSIARHTRTQLGLDCELEDLVAFAYQGLLEARRRFDPARGVQFKSFAYYRVRGALIDGVRSMAYLPRRAYARLKASEAVDSEGELIAEARAQSHQSGDAEGSLRAIDGILGRIAAAYCTATGGEGAAEEIDPEQRLLAEEQRRQVRRALSALPDPERTLLRGHYVDGRNFDQLATELGVSKSWASRLHTRALNRMREQLVAPAEDGAESTGQLEKNA